MGARRISHSRGAGELLGSCVVAVCALATAGGAIAQQEAPKRLETVVVTATRTGLSEGEPPASVTVLDQQDVQTSANTAVDDILHTIPGFSLYRRSSSIVTPPNLDPEAQGVTLRNIGPAGASRALVMVDGVPLISPFDGQVYWGKVPQDSIDHIEIVRGGGASLWGNYAMAGVINIITRKQTETGASLRATYGTDGLTDDYLFVSGRKDRLTVGLEGNFFNLDGFPVVASDQRGPIDKNGSSRDEVFNGRIGYQFSDSASVSLHGRYFDQDYNYGTKLRTAGASAGLIDLSGTVHTDDGSEWQGMVFSNMESFHIQFSEANDPRTIENRSLKQTVPSTDLGASLVWSRRTLNPLLLSAGADLHWIDGQSRDQIFDPDTGTLTDRVRSDGKQFFAGLFLQGIYTPTPQWEIALSGREDLWVNYDGTVMDANNGTSSFPSRTRASFNPRLSVLYRLTDWLHLRAAAYRAFRAPTPAELYRQSYVEGLLFLPNPNLSPERLNGAEVGVDLPVLDNVDLRATGFWAEIQDPMLDIDVAPTTANCPPTATGCRQRVNDGLARSFGAEVEALYEIIPGLTLSGSYLFNDATLVSSPQEPSIAGFQLAQIPPHTATVAVEYRNPHIITARLEGRFVDEQFEDQEHQDKQGSYFILNATVARQLPVWNGEVFIAGENLTDREYTVDHGGGIRQIGSPLIVHGGVRLRFS